MIETTGIIRNIDALGRVVLPIDTRKLFDMKEKDGLEILVDEEEGQIILQKSTKVCLRGGVTEDMDNLKEARPGFYLCDTCIEEMK